MRSLGSALITCALLVPTGVASAQSPLPAIHGGGQTINDNTMGLACTPELVNTMSLSARAVDAGVAAVFDPFGVTATTYLATGHVTLRTTPAADPGNTLAHVQGEVVCIANLGPAGGVDGVGNCDPGADPLIDVWEVRFRITSVRGVELPPEPVHGSLFVQDGGREDWADESFSMATAFDGSCLQNPFFGLERHVRGNIVVLD